MYEVQNERGVKAQNSKYMVEVRVPSAYVVAIIWVL